MTSTPRSGLRNGFSLEDPRSSPLPPFFFSELWVALRRSQSFIFTRPFVDYPFSPTRRTSSTWLFGFNASAVPLPHPDFKEPNSYQPIRLSIRPWPRLWLLDWLSLSVIQSTFFIVRVVSGSSRRGPARYLLSVSVVPFGRRALLFPISLSSPPKNGIDPPLFGTSCVKRPCRDRTPYGFFPSRRVHFFTDDQALFRRNPTRTSVWSLLFEVDGSLFLPLT